MKKRSTSKKKTAPKKKRSKKAPTRVRRFTGARSSNESLLAMRFSDLNLRWEGTWIEDCIQELYEDLERRGIRFRPHFWLSNDWFSPDKVPGVAIPFYLAHPRLMKLERSQMLEVEGGTREEFMKILRHECGHAIQHAYQFQRRRSWQKLFGKSSRKYPDFYRPNPASRRFVQHLQFFYAQSHPDEDFAETFAVWFQPKAVWRKRYEGWPALKKLEYVDQLIEDIRQETPVIRTKMQVDSLPTLRKTLREHYDYKKKLYEVGFPAAYDRDLKSIFSDNLKHRSFERASTFLIRNRAELRHLVSRWSGEYQFTVDQVLNDMIGRCRELKLRAVSPERKLRLDFSVLLTVKTMQLLYNRRNWIAL